MSWMDFSAVFRMWIAMIGVFVGVGEATELEVKIDDSDFTSGHVSVLLYLEI